MGSKHLGLLGGWLSFACAVHCAVLPIVVTFLPWLDLHRFGDERIEATLFGVAILLVGWQALPPLFQEKLFGPALLWGIGTLLVGLHFFAHIEMLERPSTIVAGLCFGVAAHWAHRKRHACDHNHPF